MMPAPIPVPILTTTTLSWPTAIPDRHSPEGEDVHVVVDPHGGVVTRREPFPDRVAVPAGHDRRRDRPSRGELDGPGHTDPDTPQAARQGTGGRPQLIEQLVDALKAGIGAGRDLSGLVVMAKDPAVEARDGDVDARRAEVGDQHVAGVRGEGQLAGRPAARARPGVALGDEPAVDQLADALGDDRPRQAGADDELGARPRPAQPDLIEDRDQRVERLLGERAAVGPAVRVRLGPVGARRTPPRDRHAADLSSIGGQLRDFLCSPAEVAEHGHYSAGSASAAASARSGEPL